MSSGSRSSRGRRRSRSRRSGAPQGTAWARFKEDLREVRGRYLKQTSTEHKRLVLLLILLGAALRAVLMLRPITGDEALAYMVFGRQPVGALLADYSLPANHLLHTLLAKWCTGLFGVSPFALRLPAALAGVLLLPFYYLFVRAMFNRYIALMALALAAVFPAQAEVSALAHGYSLTWLALSVALVLGRHLIKENNPWSGILIGLVLAIGMWAHPSMLFGAIAVLLWLLFSVLGKYERSLNERLVVLGITTAVFIAAALLLYLPIVVAHSVDQLVQHLFDQQPTWKAFSLAYPDQALGLWAWLTDPVTGWAGLLGFIALVHAAYISVKFRVLLLALVLGAVPLTVALRDVGEPMRWSYALLVFHLGSAIALFYLLKFVQDKLIASFAKRGRTAIAALTLATGFGLAALFNAERFDPYGRLPEAAPAADYLRSAMGPADRYCASPGWEHPIGFELLAARQPAAMETGPLKPGQTVFAVLERPSKLGLELTLLRCGIALEEAGPPEVVRDWPRLEIFAARKR